MEREQQDSFFACLPKEAREEIRAEYQNAIEGSDLEDFLIDFFGHHNLTSDTEPEEMLYCNKSKVQQAYKMGMWGNSGSSMLKYIFGDKCLPDKPLEEKAKEIVDTIKEDIENPIQMPETMLNPQPSVQVEPKFKVGDNVVYIDNFGIIFPEILSIKGISVAEDGKYCYEVIEYGIKYPERNLELFLEENENTRKETQNLSLSDKNPSNVSDDETKDETKDNMKEKELNLCELLKGCEGEVFYSLIDGEVKLKQLIDYDVICQYHKYHRKGYLSGCSLDGVVMLYPSRALYEKYPLDAKKAWDEWASDRKSKRWRAEKDEYFYLITTGGEVGSVQDTYSDYYNDLYKLGNYFRTKEEAQQAAEAVKECLEKFHQRTDK